MARIFVGTLDIAKVVSNIADSLRAVGHQVETGVWRKHGPFQDLEYDHDLRTLSEGLSYGADADGNVFANLPPVYREFMLGFDAYVFVACNSFLLGNMDFPLLRANGKVIISYMCGGDVRHWSAAEPMWEAWGSRLPRAIRDSSEVGTSPRMADVIGRGVYHHSLANKLHNLRLAERFSNVIFSTPDQSGLGVRPYQAFRIALDIGHCRAQIPDRTVPLVVHAPSNRGTKQTDLFLDTLARLKAEGISFELRVLEGLPNRQVLEELTNADVLIDEMSLYSATLSHEGMASGCAVLTGNASAANPLPPDVPVLHIEPSNLEHQLRRILTDRDLRLGLAHAGRPYVERMNTPKAVGTYIMHSVARAGAGKYDYFPEFIFTDWNPNPVEIVPDYIRNVTLDVLREHGAAAWADLGRLAKIGMIPPAADLASIPSWQGRFVRTGPWVWCSQDAWDIYGARANAAA